MVNMENVGKCPICGGPGQEYGERVDAGVLVKMDWCLNCETYYQNPRLKREAVDEFYRNGTYNQTYLSRAVMKDRATRLVTMLRLMEIEPKRVLDVGCGRGDLLREFQVWLGSHVVGLELFTEHAAIDEIVFDKQDVEGVFDLVTCIHTFEHFYDPQAELDWMVSKLAPSGTLLIEIPLRFKITFPHLYIFSEKAMRMMVERAGMECLYIEQDNVAQVFIGNGYSRFSVERVVEEAPNEMYRGLYGYQ